jgi:sugar phosphate isomerase/epimerase
VTRLRLSASNIGWAPADDERAAALLRAANFGGVEIAPTLRWAAPLDAPAAAIADCRAWWESRGFTIVALQSLAFGRDDLQLFGSAGSRQSFVVHLDGMAALGAALGAATLVFGSPRNRRRGDLPLAAALDVAVDFFRQVGTLLHARGLRLCIEPNPPDYHCDFITTTAEAVALVQRVNHPGIAVQGDLGAITLAGEEAGAAIHQAGTLIGYFHASEPGLAEPGRGRSDHRAAALALGEIGYRGWISIEMRTPAGSGLEPLERAVQSVRAAYEGVAR